MNWKDAVNLYFDKIYVISLPRATERHKLIERELNGLNYEFFYGADKLKFSVEDAIREGIYSPVRARKENRYYPEITHGHLACSWSHLMVYQHIVKNGYERVLIFEDDAVVIKETIEGIKVTLENMPLDWELVYFGYAKHDRITPYIKLKQLYYKAIGTLRIVPWTSEMYSSYYAKPYSKLFMQAGFHDLAHAYGVTLSGAKKLANYHTPIAFNADTMLAYAVMLNVLKAYITLPKFFDQEGVTSYINSRNVKDELEAIHQ